MTFDMRALLVMTVLGMTALAGCLSNDSGQDLDSQEATTGEPAEIQYKVPKAPDYDFTKAFDVVHAHDMRDLHTNDHNLKLLGYADLSEGQMYGPYTGGFGEVDVHEGRGLAVLATLVGPRAFTLVDISDPSDPTVLSHFYSSNDNWDVRFSEDGNFVFVGCQGTGLYTYSPVGQCPDYSGVPSPAGDQDNGVLTVDISDPTSPVGLCYTPASSVHNLETATMEDGTIVVATNAVEIFVLQDDGCLEKTGEVPGQHDSYLQYHPLTGDFLLYTGTSSLSIYNLNDPWNPVDIGTYDPGQTGTTAWHEQSPSPGLIDHRHITMGAGERMTGEPGAVGVIDTTDPELPEYMGQWRLPVAAPADNERFFGQSGYMFSEHNMDVNQHGQVCVAHYHAGVWVLDISTEERMREPVTLGFYLPHNTPTTVLAVHPAGGAMTSSPYVWGCKWSDDGTKLFVPDLNSGLYILEGQWFEPLGA